MNSTINKIARYYINNIGWKTKRRIVVFESDDWGSIRMSSKEVLKKFIKLNYIAENDFYNRVDSLASEQDLTFLFETLAGVKDKHGNPAVITANTIVANPDFKKIKESNYKGYFFEPFTDTLKKYPQHENSFELWKEGMKNQVFYPQFHGREHVNIFRWLSSLQENNTRVRLAFDHQIFGLRETGVKNLRESYMRALDYENTDQFSIVEQSLIEGLTIFKGIFGYPSQSFIAPSYVWDKKVEQVLQRHGVHYLQGIQYQYYPKERKIDLQKKFNYLGKKNNLNQRYLVRNAFFEPTLVEDTQVVDRTLQRIELAFKWNKPAIIGSHRLNYIGCINPKNRDRNLNYLKLLLNKIVQKWPTVEFMTSDQLGNLMNE